MIFKETPLKGAYLIELEPRSDERGFFARSFCMNEFEDHGLKSVVAQCNLSFNHQAGTLRGMHYQLPPAAETKLVRYTRGGSSTSWPIDTPREVFRTGPFIHFKPINHLCCVRNRSTTPYSAANWESPR